MMRFFLSGILAAAIFVAANPVSLPSVESELEVAVQRLSDRVAIFNVPSAQSTNVVALKSTHGVVVVDTEVSPVLAGAIRRRIETELEDARIDAVINTHGHGDHTYGNQVFSDALIVAHEAVRPAMESAEERRRTMAARLGLLVENLSNRLELMPADGEASVALKEKISYYDGVSRGLGEGFNLTFPTITFSDKMQLDFGDLTIELKWFGLSHSDSDILVYCPEEGLLITGDLFAPGVAPYIDSERIAQFTRWIENLEEIRERSALLTSVVPGHGEVFTPAELLPVEAFVREQEMMYAGRESAFLEVRKAVESGGIGAGLQTLGRTAAEPERYYVIHSELDSYAYHMMMEDRVDDALRLFVALAELFPRNDVAFDSLGEVRLRLGQEVAAAAAFRRALELNPDNGNAAARLAELSK